MSTQPEYILELELIKQLEDLGYKKVSIPNEEALIANLKGQLEKHNQTTFTDNEFKQILNQLSKGNIYEKAKTLRDKIAYTKEDGSNAHIELINQIHWCKNQYQVSHQIEMEGTYKTRYDVTILINGLPLVQIELKRRGLELKEAFNQINRYGRFSFGAGRSLFQYVQLFVISNGVNTKYFANNPVASSNFKQTFYWADKENKLITQLQPFAQEFLEPCHLSKMITKYIVLTTSKILMVLRPYQYYATETIVERVKTSNKFGYIWHTTGSGKTLTSFKTAQILTNIKEVYKVVFVVDRKDLDIQTIKEFNSFKKDSVDGTDNTSNLVKQLKDETKLIVTTIQKLNNAIKNPKHLNKITHLEDMRIVFIFDECHRSQFGETHVAIKSFFKEAQMFGFTGTPIFADNAAKNDRGKRTTADLFDECLHKYVITDAIRDKNVLRFSIEYFNTFKMKEGINDVNVEDIDGKEALEDERRLSNNVDYILNNHARKTHQNTFNAIFCVSNVKTLIKYYKIFQAKKDAGEHELKIATIFSYQANQLDEDAVGAVPDFDDDEFNEGQEKYNTKHTREELDLFIKDYNQVFTTSYSSNDFENYFKDVGKRVKNQQIDILLVVNMFLTGFDSKHLNTIYVDKNLKYHGLIQAFSRTNRILDEKKSQGNVVCFRNLKDATDEAITLFSNKDAVEEIVMQPYEFYVKQFNNGVKELMGIVPTSDSVNDLVSEEEEAEFIKAFRKLMRLKNVLKTFTEFNSENLYMKDQAFEDYKSKYLDLHEETKTKKTKTSILDDIDFELELIRRDDINVSYILRLLAKLNEKNTSADKEKQISDISDMLSSEAQLRSKKVLIEKFIKENLPTIGNLDNVEDEFEKFWTKEKKVAVSNLSKEEKIEQKQLIKIISDYLFTNKLPLTDNVINAMEEKPSLITRASTATRIIDKVVDFVETFINGMS